MSTELWRVIESVSKDKGIDREMYLLLSRYDGDRFDIVFADPPYVLANYSYLREKMQKVLKPNGIFCMEMKRRIIKESYVRIKHYGKTPQNSGRGRAWFQA